MSETTIGIKKSTQDRLREYGRFYESYDTIVQRLLDNTKLRKYRTNTKLESVKDGMEKS